ncbi:MAG: hypothetical protein ACOYUB_00680 [Patescibacteria group bacterium]
MSKSNQPEGTVHCPHCGQPWQVRGMHCTKCGSYIMAPGDGKWTIVVLVVVVLCVLGVIFGPDIIYSLVEKYGSF